MFTGVSQYKEIGQQRAGLSLKWLKMVFIPLLPIGV